ncbi:MAG: membrane protein insertion efficiency factor YidD [Wujia sp.]
MRKTCVKMIQFYKKNISPYKPYGCCKYYPTCSQYAIQAYEKYGTVKGTALTAKRILRCNPFSKGGYDPLP